jgi:hypothetical protein
MSRVEPHAESDGGVAAGILTSVLTDVRDYALLRQQRTGLAHPVAVIAIGTGAPVPTCEPPATAARSYLAPETSPLTPVAWGVGGRSTPLATWDVCAGVTCAGVT